jgi:hypothetical protein
MSGGYAVASTLKVPRRNRGTIGANQIKRARYTVEEKKPMKLTFKQRIRNWLLQDNDDAEMTYAVEDCEGPNIQSQGFRLNVYGASGGTIIETTKYDRKNDDNRHSLHVVTEDKDLGEELAKIITMESLR